MRWACYGLSGERLSFLIRNGSGMSPELIVAIGLAIVALGSGLVRAFEDVQGARSRVEKLAKSRLSQLDRIRKAARSSLQLKRAIAEAEKRKVATEEEVERAVASLETANDVDHRVFVLDDRRTKVDQNWIATIVHPAIEQSISPTALQDAIDSWHKGRRFLVFALDGGKARDKIVARYPERLGYQVVSIEIQPPPKAKKNQMF